MMSRSRGRASVVALAVFATLAAPATGDATPSTRELAALRAEVKTLRQQLKILRAEIRRGVVAKRPANTAANVVRAAGPGVVPLSLQTASGQDEIQRWLDPLGNLVARVRADGFYNGIDLFGYTNGTDVLRQPVFNFYSDGRLKWQTALDTYNRLNDDFVLAVRGRDEVGAGHVEDVIYLRDYDGFVTTGFSITPPMPGYRVQIGSPDGSDWGALRLRIGENARGDALEVQNSAGAALFAVDRAGRLVPRDGRALPVIGDLRIRSADIGDPSALLLNGNPSDTGTDVRVRNVHSASDGTYVFVVDGGGRDLLTIRQDTGAVTIPSGQLKLGNGILFEEAGALRWRAPTGATTTLASP